MAKPCPSCGQWVERVPDGRAYNDDGTWHAKTCRPDRAWQKKERLRRAEWEARNKIKADDRREIRADAPLYLRGRG
jgi:hypothetical protein